MCCCTEFLSTLKRCLEAKALPVSTTFPASCQQVSCVCLLAGVKEGKARKNIQSMSVSLPELQASPTCAAEDLPSQQTLTQRVWYPAAAKLHFGLRQCNAPLATHMWHPKTAVAAVICGHNSFGSAMPMNHTLPASTKAYVRQHNVHAQQRVSCLPGLPAAVLQPITAQSTRHPCS